MTASAQAIHDRARDFALFEGGRRLLEAIVQGAALPAVLEDLCRLVEDVVGGCRCTVLLVDASGTRMEHGAAPSVPDAYNRRLVGRPAAAEFGPCGMAVAVRDQVIVQDIAKDERWAMRDWQQIALAHGLRACWSTPILSPSRVPLGTFALYWATPERPGPPHQNVINQMTYIAAVAIERARAAAVFAREGRPPADANGSAGELGERTGQAPGSSAPSIDSLRESYASLTPREREVMTWVVAGLPNKRIAAELGTAEITIKAHRGRAMRKMRAASLADLVRMAARLDVPLPR